MSTIYLASNLNFKFTTVAARFSYIFPLDYWIISTWEVSQGARFLSLLFRIVSTKFHSAHQCLFHLVLFPLIFSYTSGLNRASFLTHLLLNKGHLQYLFCQIYNLQKSLYSLHGLVGSHALVTWPSWWRCFLLMIPPVQVDSLSVLVRIYLPFVLDISLSSFLFFSAWSVFSCSYTRNSFLPLILGLEV